MLIASRRIPPREAKERARTCRGENAHEHSIRMAALNVSLPDKKGGPKAAPLPTIGGLRPAYWIAHRVRRLAHTGSSSEQTRFDRGLALRLED